MVPEGIAQFWTTYWFGYWVYGGEVSIEGNREGLEAFRNACAALSLRENSAVYFPCRKNGGEWMSLQEKGRYALRDLVLMKPNSLKVSDWKEIRNRISKTKPMKWSHTFQEKFEDMRVAEKYCYRAEGKKTFRFDTVFYVFPQFVYPGIAAGTEMLLQEDLEYNARHFIYWKPDWMPLYCGADLSTEVGFLDDDIVKKQIGKEP